MKKMTSILAVLFIITTQVSAQTGEKKGWPAVERNAFIRECIKSASVNMGIDTARFYCFCMLQKVETKFPDPAQSAKELTAEKLASAEWQAEIRACLKGYWSTLDRTDFMNSCIEAAKSMGEEKAKNYCGCMLFKMENKYPESSKAGEITKEEMEKPEWQKAIKECLNF
jgi:hypothetical protein